MQRIPTFKEILNIALPLMLGGLSESLASVVDTAFMGSLGTREMDAMGMNGIFYMLIMMIGWSLSRSVQISVSQNFGAKKDKNIADIMYNSLLVMVPISIFLLLMLIFYSKPLLNILIHNPNLLSIATEISVIRAWGIPIVMFTMILSSFYTGISFTKPIVYIQGLAAISNIILNYGLVFGHFGLPEMGYRGSATATVLSELIAFLFLLVSFLYRKDLVVKYQLFSIRKMKMKIVKELGNLAYPMLILHFFSLGAWVYFFSLIERMGEIDLAISIILKQIFMIVALPSFCMANTSNTLVGKLVGSRDIDSIIPTIKKIAYFNFFIMIGVVLFLFSFHYQLVDIFTDDSRVLDNYYYTLLILLSIFFVMPFANVTFNSISALGNTKIPLFIELSVIVIYMVYVYLVINTWHLGLEMAWTSEVFYWVLMIIFTIGYFYIGDWKKRIVFLDT